jgi:hypothetical protein
MALGEIAIYNGEYDRLRSPCVPCHGRNQIWCSIDILICDGLREEIMKRKLLVSLSLATLIVTILWIVFLIAGMATTGPVETFDQALALAQNPGIIFYLTYLNAALVTVFASMLMAGIYVYLRTAMHGWPTIAFVFVPAYAALNLFSYLSQITVLPYLANLQVPAEYVSTAQFLTAQMVQQWSQSVVAQINLLAYAVLAVPLIIFGTALARSTNWIKTGAILFIISGISALIGLAGAIFQSQPLTLGVMISGVFFLLALIPLAIGFNQERIM